MESIWRLIKNVEEWREEKLWDIIKLEKKTWRRAKEWTIKNEKHIYKFFTSWEYNNLYTDKYDFDWEYLIIWDWGAANINYVNWKFWVSWHNFVFSSKKENWKNIIDNKFLYYYLYFSKEEWNNLYTWIWIKNISKTDLKEIPVLVPYKNWKPDLETQQKIADFLNECFDKLNNADKYLQLIFQSANQKRWWKTTIDKEFINKNYNDLIEKFIETKSSKKNLEKENLRNDFKYTLSKWNLIDNLWKSILEGVFNESYLKKKFNWVEWREEKLWNFITIKSWYNFKSALFGNEWPSIIKIGDINDNTLNVEPKEKVNVDINNYKKYIVNKWDILIWMSWSIWKIWIYKKEELALLNQRVWNIQLKKWHDNFPKKYLLYYLSFIKKDILLAAYWNAQPNISWKDLEENFKIPIPYKNWKPDLETQQEIADILDEAFIYYNRVKDRAWIIQERIWKIKWLILKNIFETANNLSSR